MRMMAHHSVQEELWSVELCDGKQGVLRVQVNELFYQAERYFLVGDLLSDALQMNVEAGDVFDLMQWMWLKAREFVQARFVTSALRFDALGSFTCIVRALSEPFDPLEL
jgi:hypothetical protein